MRFRALLPTLLAAAVAATFPPPAAAQHSPRQLTDSDYAHAERFLSYNTGKLVFGATVRPTWLAGDRFWYRNTIREGFEFVLVDPARKSRERAFDQAKLAAALSKAADTTYDPYHLPFATFAFTADGRGIGFDVGHRHWTCDLGADRCTAEPRHRSAAPPNSVLSPDSTKAAFIRDWNLWVKDLATGKETQLTTDGVENFGYATDNAGWIRSDRPIVLWSPDSKKIATFQQDQRRDGDMYLVRTEIGHPVLEAWKYPLPGDSDITMIQRVVVDLAGPKVVRLHMPPDQHRSTLCDDISCGFGPNRTWDDIYWSPDSRRLVFVSTARNHQKETVRVADAESGAVHDVFDETADTWLESGYNHVDWQPLWATDQFLWYSEKSNWGHLYLYDLGTGRLVNQVTTGDWDVLQVRRVDEASHTIWFTGAGREPGDPYFQRFYSVRTDGSHLRLLTPEDADHEVTMAPDGRYFLDSYSTPEVPPVAVLRDADGRLVMTVERADISRLVAAGWKPPIPFTVKARDDSTLLYGLLFRPTHFDSTATYPIINHIYPGPQVGSVGSRSFESARADCQALAELGFVVVELDAMGTPMRSHSFMAKWYGDMGDNGLPDQVSAMRQLAARYPWIDLSRAGIYGHSGGGFATADAMFRYPDFFKVGIAEAGNHDNRNYEDDWGEKWQGLLVRHGDSTSYDNQANELIARDLKGHLLLAYGTTDDNVTPYPTLLVVDSLIAANKDFDLLALPNRRHGFGNEPYMIRRRWDYFVRHLLGAVPPHEYQMRPPVPARRGR
jgi:dipeptidyl aminopeptidase/acylaminoacyl peptidase